MKKDKEKEKYESPFTKKTQVNLESGICANSKEKVVIDDENTTVNIEEQTNGGSFEIDTWD